MNNGQQQYDEWSRETPIHQINSLNAPSVNEIEKEFIQRANPQKVLLLEKRK